MYYMFSICTIMNHEFYIGLVKTRMTVAPTSSRAQLITSALQLETPPLGSLQSRLVSSQGQLCRFWCDSSIRVPICVCVCVVSVLQVPTELVIRWLKAVGHCVLHNCPWFHLCLLFQNGTMYFCVAPFVLIGISLNSFTVTVSLFSFLMAIVVIFQNINQYFIFHLASFICLDLRARNAWWTLTLKFRNIA